MSVAAVGDWVLSCRDIVRSFGATRALRGVDLDIGRGKVHALLGENGAGKSTLLRCFAGLQKPDGGTLLVRGRALHAGSCAAAARAGIGMLEQSGGLADSLTVIGNLAPAAAGLGRLRWRSVRARVSDALAEQGCFARLDALTGSLSCGERLKVELARLLLAGRSILLLDEPVSALSCAEEEALYARLGKLAGEGVSVLVTGHRVHRLLAAADTVHVLRKGRLTLRSARAGALSAAQVREAMFGGEEVSPKSVDREDVRPGANVLELRSLVLPGFAHSNDLTVRAGEIVGVAGMSGNGQRELMEVLAGLAEPRSGDVLVGGVRVAAGARRAAGLRCIMEDPAADACMPGMTVAENLALHVHARPPFSHFGLLDAAQIRSWARGMVRAHSLAVRSTRARFGWLSGGNQRKLLVARETFGGCLALVAHNPAAGLDRRAATALSGRLESLRSAGTGILLIAEELDLLAQLPTKLFLMEAGKLRVQPRDSNMARIIAG